MRLKQLKEAKAKGEHPFRFTDCLTKLEKFMHDNPNMEFVEMARQLNRTVTAMENTYERLEAKRKVYNS